MGGRSNGVRLGWADGGGSTSERGTPGGDERRTSVYRPWSRAGSPGRSTVLTARCSASQSLAQEFGDAVQRDLGTPMQADSAAVFVPASVLAAVVSEVRTGPPIGREVVAILDRHMVVLDHIVVFHVVVGPRPPGPHGDCRLLDDDRRLVHHLARRDGGHDCTAAQVRDQHADNASPQQVSSHGPFPLLPWGPAESWTDAARLIAVALR